MNFKLELIIRYEELNTGKGLGRDILRIYYIYIKKKSKINYFNLNIMAITSKHSDKG